MSGKWLTILSAVAGIFILARFMPEVVVAPVSTFLSQLRSGDVTTSEQLDTTPIQKLNEGIRKLLK